MCGITGFVNFDGITDNASDIIKRMTRTLSKRGPDGSGTWVGPAAVFGHTRLSIIDIAGGAQPMSITSKADTPLVITYNGELYNYRELRDQLRRRGHSFETQSDTEVILHAYDEWGEDCVRHFTGMFAFALWDDAKQALFLARDPLGVKPLYYYQTPHGIVFGSEEKSLLAHPDVPAQLDHTGLAELFCMVPMTNPDGAIFRGMGQLRPGHTAMVSADRFTKTCYWKLEAIPHTDDEKTTVRKLRELFTEAVHGQLVSDVPLGSMLSGGVDSSAVAALSARFQKEAGLPLPTFAIDYASEEASYSSSQFHVDRDTPWAEKVAKFISSKHSTHYVPVQDLLEAQKATLDAWGRPSYSPINVSLHLLFKHIRESGVRVVLGGEGADETVAGYKWWRELEDVTHDGYPWHRAYREASYLLWPGLRKQIDPEAYIRNAYKTALKQVPTLQGESEEDRRAREISWMTYTYYLNFLLHRVDRTSMAASVEARVPFCDHKLVQYAWNIPWELKNAGDMEKGILRKAVEDLLPKDVAWRRKSGYPTAQMIEYKKAQWAAMRDMLRREEPIWDVVDKKVMTDIINDHEDEMNEWTWLNHVSYILEMNTWWKQYDIKFAFN